MHKHDFVHLLILYLDKYNSETIKNGILIEKKIDGKKENKKIPSNQETRHCVYVEWIDGGMKRAHTMSIHKKCYFA